METTKQSENLLKEIHHRVKNNFAILVSLINMQLSQCSNEEVIKSLTNLQLRIRSMALVHEMLYRSKDFQKISFHEYLRSVTAVIAGTYNRHDIELIFHADETTMNIETLIPLGLIVNELVSNVYKHAFPDQPKGTLWVTFKKEPGSTSCLLTIKDNGIGLPAFAMTDTVTTMGLQIVHLLCRQIEAELAITNEPGATFNISFFQE
jgi:two-component sensor histidine kinase